MHFLGRMTYTITKKSPKIFEAEIMKLSPKNLDYKYSKKKSELFGGPNKRRGGAIFIVKKPIFDLFSMIKKTFNHITTIKTDFYLLNNIKCANLNFFACYANKKCNYYCYEYKNGPNI